MKLLAFPLAALLICAGCAGGGSSSAPMPTPRASATPTPAPTSTPTTAPAGKGRAVAFTTNTALGQTIPASIRRTAAAGVQAVPTLVEAIGGVNLDTSLVAWEYDTTTGTPIADGVPTITPTNAAATSIDTIAPVTASGFTDAYSAGINALEIAQTSETVAFANASGTIPVYVYPSGYLACAGSAASPNGTPYTGYVWNSGTLDAVSVGTPDFAIDCTNAASPSLVFAHGAIETAAPVADAYGSTLSAFTTVLATATVGTSASTAFTQAQAPIGEIISYNTGEGTIAKMIVESDNAPGYFGVLTMESSGGAYAY